MVMTMGNEMMIHKKREELKDFSTLPFPRIDNVKEVVIVGNYGDGNVGDEALLDVLIELISKNFGQVKIIVPSRAPAILKIIHHKNFCPVGIATGLCKALLADVLILGAGTLFSRSTGIGIYIAIVIAILRKLIFKKKTYFYGIGYSSTTPFLLKILTMIAFRVSDGIYLRDNFSIRRVANYLGIKSVYPVPTQDLAFFLKKSASIPKCFEDIKRNRRDLLVGILLLYPSENKGIVVESFKKFIEYLHFKYNATICFLVFCPAFVSNRSDKEIALRVINQLAAEVRKNVHVLPYCSPSMTLKIIEELDFVISMRYHGLIFAYKENKPFIAISFEDKHRDFLGKYMGESIDLKSLTVNELIKKFRHAYKKMAFKEN